LRFVLTDLFFVLLAEIAKKEIPQAVGMLHSFKNKLNEKRGAVGAKPRTEEGSRGGPSKKRGREGGNIARTVRAVGQMPTPPPARSARPSSPPTDEFNRPIPTGVAVPLINACVGGGRSVLLTGRELQVASQHRRGDQVGPRRDLLDGGIEMIRRGLVLARRGADARRSRVEDMSRLEHELQEAGQNLKQAVEANTTYEKKLYAQAAELELRQNRLAELEKADADKAAEVILLRKALEAADRRATLMEEEAAAEREAKRAAEAEVLKTMEDTMVLIGQSFDLAVRQAEVLYGGPPPSGRFDQDMEVADGRLVPAAAGPPADEAEADPSNDVLNIVD